MSARARGRTYICVYIFGGISIIIVVLGAAVNEIDEPFGKGFGRLIGVRVCLLSHYTPRQRRPPLDSMG